MHDETRGSNRLRRKEGSHGALAPGLPLGGSTTQAATTAIAPSVPVFAVCVRVCARTRVRVIVVAVLRVRVCARARVCVGQLLRYKTVVAAGRAPGIQGVVTAIMVSSVREAPCSTKVRSRRSLAYSSCACRSAHRAAAARNPVSIAGQCTRPERGGVGPLCVSL